WRVLSNARRNFHLVEGLRLILWNLSSGSFAKIKRVLGEPPQDVHRQLIRVKEAGQEFDVATSVGEIRKRELAPGADTPMTISVIHRFHRGPIRPGEIFMKGRRASQRP